MLSTADPDQQTLRGRHIRLLAEQGRIGWQHVTGHGRRNHAETTMGCYKAQSPYRCQSGQPRPVAQTFQTVWKVSGNGRNRQV